VGWAVPISIPLYIWRESRPITSPSILPAISTARSDFPQEVGPIIIRAGVFEFILLIDDSDQLNAVFPILFQTVYPIHQVKVVR
jgi:hypothetical protein